MFFLMPASGCNGYQNLICWLNFVFLEYIRKKCSKSVNLCVLFEYSVLLFFINSIYFVMDD